ncbi:MAG TPA: hypothetical protein DCS41_06670 [Gammaproteobacteria bacterium]|nr:hypothetical protein [Gammaproteobacteria bacterium]
MLTLACGLGNYANGWFGAGKVLETDRDDRDPSHVVRPSNLIIDHLNAAKCLKRIDRQMKLKVTFLARFRERICLHLGPIGRKN